MSSHFLCKAFIWTTISNLSLSVTLIYPFHQLSYITFICISSQLYSATYFIFMHACYCFLFILFFSCCHFLSMPPQDKAAYKEGKTPDQAELEKPVCLLEACLCQLELHQQSDLFFKVSLDKFKLPSGLACFVVVLLSLV